MSMSMSIIQITSTLSTLFLLVGIAFISVDVYLSVTHLKEPNFYMGLAKGTFLVLLVGVVAFSIASVFYAILGFPLFRVVFTCFDKLEGKAKVGAKMVMFLTMHGLELLSVYAGDVLEYGSIFMFTHLVFAAKLTVGDDKYGILEDLAFLYWRRIVEVLLLHFIFPKKDEGDLNLWEVGLMAIPACIGVFAMMMPEIKYDDVLAYARGRVQVEPARTN